MNYIKATEILSLQYRQEEAGCFFAGTDSPEVTLFYVTHGSLHIVTQGQDLLLSQGSAFLCPPGQWYMTYAEQDVAPLLLHIIFSVTGEYFGSFAFVPSHPAASILANLRDECRTPDILSTEMCQLLLNQLLLQLHREQHFRSAEPLTGEQEIIDRAQQVMGHHVRQRLNVPLAAQKTGISPSYLTALFLKHLHMGPGEYIRRVKLQESKNMIREGTLTFTQIAAALEYSTVHHFSRQFKENFGITPTQYAKSVR